MTPVTPEEAEFRRKLRTEGMALARASTVALSYRLAYGPREHMGTGVLVQIDDFRFMFTNAHVVDQFEKRDDVGVTIPNGARIPLTVRPIRSKIPEGKTREQDYLDFAICEIVEPEAKYFEGITFLRMIDFDQDDEQDPASDYFLYGYADKALMAEKYKGISLTTTLYDTTKKGHPEGHVPAREILFEYPKDGVTDDEGNHVDLPDAPGLSGCGMWRLRHATMREKEWSKEHVKLVGIQHSWGKISRYARGTRIGFYLDTIRLRYPELRDAMKVVYHRGTFFTKDK